MDIHKKFEDVRETIKAEATKERDTDTEMLVHMADMVELFFTILGRIADGIEQHNDIMDRAFSPSITVSPSIVTPPLTAEEKP